MNGDTSHTVKPVALLNVESIKPKFNKTTKAASSMMNIMSTKYDVITFRK